MEYKDYYDILGVERDASDREIKQAFRRLARRWHPDVNSEDGQAEERFKEINEAYEVLSDPQKRAKYDHLGQSWSQWQRSGGAPGAYDWSQWFTGAPRGAQVRWSGDLGDLFGGARGEAFSDFFRAIFGGGRTQGADSYRDTFGRTGTYGGSAPGQNVEAEVTITLAEAYDGTARVLERGGRRIRVTIPAGVQTGSKVRIAGEGHPGATSESPGDLYLNVTVTPHPTFTRDGDDLRCALPVDLYTAVLGGQTQLQTLRGDVSLKIPPGTQGGQTFRLRGKGMPNPRQPGQYGNLFATVEIVVPTTLSARERDLFEALAQSQRKD